MPNPTAKQSRFHGTPGIVVVWLLAAVFTAIVAYDLGVKPSYLIAIAIALLVGATGSMLAPTLQDLGRRQPRLVLSAVQADPENPARVTAPHLSPWPVDTDRVVANEIAEAEASLEIGSLSPSFIAITSFLTIPASKEAHERALEQFSETLAQHARELRDWLGDYAQAALARSETLEVTLRLANESPTAHADDVIVELDLPPTVAANNGSLRFGAPPKRPRYQPPEPRSVVGIGGLDGPNSRRVMPSHDFTPSVRSLEVSKSPNAWTASTDGRRLHATAGDAHAGQSIGVARPLLLRAQGAGSHQIPWRAYTRSARRASEGVLTLVVPRPSSGRPAFGRLGGVRAYPDVDLVDKESGDILVVARTADPPLRPPEVPKGADFSERIKKQRAMTRWRDLGFDPSTDTPNLRPVVPGDD